MTVMLPGSFLSARFFQKTLIPSHPLKHACFFPCQYILCPYLWGCLLPSSFQVQLKLYTVSFFSTLWPHTPKPENLLHARHHDGRRQGGEERIVFEEGGEGTRKRLLCRCKGARHCSVPVRLSTRRQKQTKDPRAILGQNSKFLV